MSGFQRTDRVASVIQAELGELLLREVRDPSVAAVSITAVKVTRDFSFARIYFLVMDSGARSPERARAAAEQGLERAKGFLRRELAKRVSLRTMPELSFHWDQSVEHGRHMDEVFAEIERERNERPPHISEDGDIDEQG